MTAEPRLNRARVIDGVILVAIVSVVLWVVLGSASSGATGLVGKPAPMFKLRTMDGVVTGPPDHAGKVVLLDFWATWCDPCFKQMPAIHTVMKERGEDLVVLAVNVDDPGPSRQAAMERFLADAGLEIDSLMDDGAVELMYRVERIPTLVLIDESGTVTYASSGVHSAKELNERLDALDKGAP